MISDRVYNRLRRLDAEAAGDSGGGIAFGVAIEAAQGYGKEFDCAENMLRHALQLSQDGAIPSLAGEALAVWEMWKAEA